MSHPAFHRLWDKAPYGIDYLDGQGSDLVIAFASIGHDPGRPPSPEFVATATGRGTGRGMGRGMGHAPRRALFVTDAGRGWASDPGFAPALLGALAMLRRLAPVDRIACMGLSMGGFAALAAMQVLPVSVTLAFGPQHRVLARAPDRWSDWTGRIPADTPYPVAPLPAPGQGWACLFHGLRDDHAEALAFPHRAGTDHFLFADQSHSSLVPHLKSRGVLAGLLEAALAGDRRRLIRIATSAGGQRRKA